MAHQIIELKIEGEFPMELKVPFDMFINAICIIDSYEKSKTREAYNAGLLKKIVITSGSGASFYPFVKEGVVYFSKRYLFFIYSYSFALYLLTEHVMTRELSHNWDGEIIDSNETRWANKYIGFAKQVLDGREDWDPELMNPGLNYIGPRDVGVIFGMELTFVFLHEIGHLLLKHDPKMDNESKILAEKEADQIALEIFFSNVIDTNIERNRAIAIAVLLLCSLNATGRIRDLVGKTHPDKDTRIGNIMDYFNIKDQKANYYVKKIASIGLILYCADNKISISKEIFETVDDLFEDILSRIADQKER